jgi:hypothetical protein
MESFMKRLLLVAAAAALLASPVFAQTEKPAQAQKGQATTQKAPAVKGPNDVYCGGQYLGSDPDPKVRLQLLRDYKHECGE